MHRLKRPFLCGLIFALILAAEIAVLVALRPFHSLTYAEIEAFLYFSLGLAFIPLILLAFVVLFLVTLMLAVAYFPARCIWRWGEPNIGRQAASSVSEFLQQRREFQHKLQLERAKLQN
jgi:hypothetical protein